MKRLILTTLFAISIAFGYTQCINADFSAGSFTTWSGSTGINSYGNYSSIVNGLVQGTMNSGPNDPGRHTIINAPGTDPNTGNLLSVLPPGAFSCARLGNMDYNGEAERLSFPINVTILNSIFTYQYAVVLEDPGHTATEQPKFTIYVKDAGGTVVDPVCGIYEVTAAAGIPGFQTSSASDDGETVRWKDWTTVGVDLSSYVGQTVTIEFTTFDCAINQGAHFGYAYLSCSCSSLQLGQECLGTSSVVTAPAGFDSYQWSTGETTQSVTYNNPVNGTVVTVICTSVQGCQVTLQTTLSVDPPIYTIIEPPGICLGESATISTTGTNTYTWSTGEVGPSITVTPSATTNYTVTITTAGGCSATEEAVVTISPAAVANAGNDVYICAGESTTLNASGSSGGTLSYLWSSGDATVTSTVTPSSTTTYTVTVSSGINCTATDEVIVNVPALLTATITDNTPVLCNGGVMAA